MLNMIRIALCMVPYLVVRASFDANIDYIILFVEFVRYHTSYHSAQYLLFMFLSHRPLLRGYNSYITDCSKMCNMLRVQ